MTKRWLCVAFVLWAASVFGANKFCWSGATGLNDGSKWEDAYTSCARDWGAEAGFTPATDFVYCRSTHNETGASDKTIRGSTAEGATLPVRILSVAGNDTGTSPGALTAGCTISTDDTAGLNVFLYEGLYLHGVTISPWDDLRINDINIDGLITLEDSTLAIRDNDGVVDIHVGGDADNDGFLTVWKNVDIDFQGNTGQSIVIQSGTLIWEGGELLDDTASLFVASSNLNHASVWVRGVDLDILTGNLADPETGGGSLVVNVENSSTSASMSIGTLDIPGSKVVGFYADSGTSSNPSLQMRQDDMHGFVEEDTARTRTGGASDGTTSYSWTMDTTANTRARELYDPFRGPAINFWLAGDGTSKTVRFYAAAGAIPDNDEFWIDCLVGSNSVDTSSLGEWVTTRPDPLATPSAYSSDPGNDWSGTDVTADFLVDVTASPDKDSLWRCWPSLALDGERVSIDPKADPQ